MGAGSPVDLATANLNEPATIKSGDSADLAIVRINRAIALKRLGRTDEMNYDLDFLEANGDTAEANIKAGVAALRQDKAGMIAALREALMETLSPESLQVFPVFEDYRNDPDFLKLAKPHRKDDPEGTRIKLLRRPKSDETRRESDPEEQEGSVSK